MPFTAEAVAASRTLQHLLSTQAGTNIVPFSTQRLSKWENACALSAHRERLHWDFDGLVEVIQVCLVRAHTSRDSLYWHLPAF